jgi:hypothetical protein
MISSYSQNLKSEVVWNFVEKNYIYVDISFV